MAWKLLKLLKSDYFEKVYKLDQNSLSNLVDDWSNNPILWKTYDTNLALKLTQAIIFLTIKVSHKLIQNH